jgi:hypothetical protein
MADYLTFKNIYEETERLVTDLAGAKETAIKEVVNMAYWEMLSCDELWPLYWLRELDDTLAAKNESTISGITQANPGVVTTAAAHGLVAGDLVSIHNVVGMTEVNNRSFRVGTVPLSTTFQLNDFDASNLNTSAYTAYSSGGDVNHRGLTLATTGKNVERILSVAWHDYTGTLDEITPKELESNAAYWNENTSRPKKYLHRKSYGSTGTEINQLLWFPASDAAYDLRYWIEKRAAPLSSDADVPLLPPRFHHGIVAGAVTKMIEVGAQVAGPAVWPVTYRWHIQQLKSFNRKFYKDNEESARKTPYLL